MNTESRTIVAGDIVAEAIALAKKADELRGTAISQLLAQREQIERDLKTLGYKPSDHDSTTVNGFKPGTVDIVAQAPRNNTKRFRDLTLAAVVAIVLGERGPLHGKLIEEAAKAGGFNRGTNNFQNYLPVALKRDGRFDNLGGNVWKLKETSTDTA